MTWCYVRRSLNFSAVSSSYVSIIAQMWVLFFKYFGIMAHGRRRPEERVR